MTSLFSNSDRCKPGGDQGGRRGGKRGEGGGKGRGKDRGRGEGRRKVRGIEKQKEDVEVNLVR